MTKSESLGLLLCDDLIFTSKITATAHAHGLVIRTARTIDSLVRLAEELKPAAIILELDHSDFDIAATLVKLPKTRIIAYGSHVDVERLKTARKAGCDLVMPRSQFVESLESDLPAWLTVSQPG
jgi:hypothetical protein